MNNFLQKDVWIDWNQSGDCPLPEGTVIHAKDRDDTLWENQVVGRNNCIDDYFWTDEGDWSNQIGSYFIVSLPEGFVVKEDKSLTPCEKLGYKVGDKFKVVSHYELFKIHSIISLENDDKSDMPLFTDGLRSHYIRLEGVNKVSGSEQWIEWHGGECPVEAGTLLDIEYRDGAIVRGIKAVKGAKDGYTNSNWENNDFDRGIIAYRLSQVVENTEDLPVPEELNDVVDKEEVSNQDSQILSLISLIADIVPEVKVQDAWELANTLIEDGWTKQEESK